MKDVYSFRFCTDYQNLKHERIHKIITYKYLKALPNKYKLVGRVVASRDGFGG